MEPSILTVVVTGLVLVFCILILLYFIISMQGRIFQSIENKKQASNQKAKVSPVKASPAPAAPAPAPVVEAGISGEVVAAISAAVTAVAEGPVAVRSITRAGGRKNGWGLAAVYSYTQPF